MRAISEMVTELRTLKEENRGLREQMLEQNRGLREQMEEENRGLRAQVREVAERVLKGVSHPGGGVPDGLGSPPALRADLREGERHKAGSEGNTSARKGGGCDVAGLTVEEKDAVVVERMPVVEAEIGGGVRAARGVEGGDGSRGYEGGGLGAVVLELSSKVEVRTLILI